MNNPVIYKLNQNFKELTVGIEIFYGGNSKMAHLIEHLVFSDEKFIKYKERYFQEYNATTFINQTVFFFVFKQGLSLQDIEKGFKIIINMVFNSNKFNKEIIKTEKEIVIQERQIRYNCDIISKIFKFNSYDYGNQTEIRKYDTKQIQKEHDTNYIKENAKLFILCDNPFYKTVSDKLERYYFKKFSQQKWQQNYDNFIQTIYNTTQFIENKNNVSPVLIFVCEKQLTKYENVYIICRQRFQNVLYYCYDLIIWNIMFSGDNEKLLLQQMRYKYRLLYNFSSFLMYHCDTYMQYCKLTYQPPTYNEKTVYNFFEALSKSLTNSKLFGETIKKENVIETVCENLLEQHQSYILNHKLVFEYSIYQRYFFENPNSDNEITLEKTIDTLKDIQSNSEKHIQPIIERFIQNNSLNNYIIGTSYDKKYLQKIQNIFKQQNTLQNCLKNNE